ncbi:MAG TPA: aminoglycoside phosphotransferase family protein, partial [Acidimicrobiia bacterium]|nr:aminoglycoside phosphotransferase family protein [Acidimicrobiia bacterium]
VAGRFTGQVTAIRPFGEGHINETFLVETGAGDLVVQRVNTAVFPDPDAVTANILSVHRHLRGGLMPEPVATPDGEWLVRDGSGTWRAWRRVPGAGPAPRRPSPVSLHSAGSLLGRFHGLLADLDPAALTETLPAFHDPGRRLDDLRAVMATDPCGRAAAVEREVGMALAGEPLVLVAADLAARVPRRVAHYDAKLDNVLFAGDEAVCLVDFDTVMPGAWWWDVGDLLRSAASPGAEDDPDPDRAVVVPWRYRAILDGYREALAAGGAADAAELEALEVAGAIVTYEQAVRFLTDWIAGDVYYRVARPTQNLDRARAQFRLLDSMPH